VNTSPITPLSIVSARENLSKNEFVVTLINGEKIKAQRFVKSVRDGITQMRGWAGMCGGQHI
jgi:hypothetical protein